MWLKAKILLVDQPKPENSNEYTFASITDKFESVIDDEVSLNHRYEKANWMPLNNTIANWAK